MLYCSLHFPSEETSIPSVSESIGQHLSSICLFMVLCDYIMNDHIWEYRLKKPIPFLPSRSHSWATFIIVS